MSQPAAQFAVLTLAAVPLQAVAQVTFDTNTATAFIQELGYYMDGTSGDGAIIDNGFRGYGDQGVQFYGDVLATLDADLRSYGVRYVPTTIGTTIVGPDLSVPFSWDFDLELIGSPTVDVLVRAGSMNDAGLPVDVFSMLYTDVSADSSFTGTGMFDAAIGVGSFMEIRVEFSSGVAGDGAYFSMSDEIGRGLRLGTIPAPGSVILLGAGGFVAARRRR